MSFPAAGIISEAFFPLCLHASLHVYFGCACADLIFAWFLNSFVAAFNVTALALHIIRILQCLHLFLLPIFFSCVISYLVLSSFSWGRFYKLCCVNAGSLISVVQISMPVLLPSVSE